MAMAMRYINALNLGGGVQSTTLYLLSMSGQIPKYDVAIFADTQDEPGAEERRLGLPDPPNSVYAHLDWMDTLSALGGAKILRRTQGHLSAALMRRENSTRQRFATIPAFTSKIEGVRVGRGQLRRQCASEYKIRVIERAIRRDVLGLRPRQRVPRGVTVIQHIGMSWSWESAPSYHPNEEHHVFQNRNRRRGVPPDRPRRRDRGRG
jgi:hypothetical protein